MTYENQQTSNYIIPASKVRYAWNKYFLAEIFLQFLAVAQLDSRYTKVLLRNTPKVSLETSHTRI